MWRLLVGVLLVTGCGGVRSAGLSNTPQDEDASGAWTGSDAGVGGDASAVDSREQDASAPEASREVPPDAAPVVDVLPTPPTDGPIGVDLAGDAQLEGDAATQADRAPRSAGECVGMACRPRDGTEDPVCTRYLERDEIFCLAGHYVSSCPGCQCNAGNICWMPPFPDGLFCSANTDCLGSYCMAGVCGKSPGQVACAGKSCGGDAGDSPSCAGVLPCVDGVYSYLCGTDQCPPAFPTCVHTAAAQYCR